MHMNIIGCVFYFMNVNTHRLTHNLCINSLNLPEIRQNQRFDHTHEPPNVRWQIFGFAKPVYGVKQPNNLACGIIFFPNAYPVQADW